jgi:hypothetical protein
MESPTAQRRVGDDDDKKETIRFDIFNPLPLALNDKKKDFAVTQRHTVP